VNERVSDYNGEEGAECTKVMKLFCVCAQRKTWETTERGSREASPHHIYNMFNVI